MNTKTLLIRVGAPAVLALGLLGAAGPAFASTGPGSFSAAGTQPGNSSLIKATFTYGDPVFGNVSCAEIHHQNGAQDFDSVSCTFLDGPRLDLVTGLPAAPVGWLSDFAYNGTSLTTHPAKPDTKQVNLTYTVNAAGPGYTGTTDSYSG